MSDSTKIEWTDATWNPIRGCSRVSQGCVHCYAEGVARRFSGPGQPYEGLINKHGSWNGEIAFIEHALEQPLRWKRPRRIFVNSMSDLFHENITDEQITKIFHVMERAGRHTFQVLTKRPERMRCYMLSYAEKMMGPPSNVWLGTSVENQETADERIPLLLQTPAAVRWISAEPLLGPINLARPLGAKSLEVAGDAPLAMWPLPVPLHWVVVGGESGLEARAMNVDWARLLRDQCEGAEIPFFFKQWGNWLGAMQDGNPDCKEPIINASDESIHTTKKAAGRLLDGREHNEYPA